VEGVDGVVRVDDRLGYDVDDTYLTPPPSFLAHPV
jgi:hypothetical protein